MAILPKVKLKTIPVFPAAVSGGNAIDVTKENGEYTIDLDVSDFQIAAVADADTPTVYAVSWGYVTADNPEGSYRLVPFSGLQGASQDLTSLADLGTFGIVARTAGATYATRTITAGTGLGVTNGNGVSGNPTVALTDAELLALAGLTSAADKLPYFTGSGTASLADFTTFGRQLVDDADATAARTTLGLTSPATATPAALTKTDDTNVTLTLGGTPTTALLQATSITVGWSGTLAATRGGTGTGSYAVGDLLYASTTSALSKLADIATGNALISGGVGVAPSWGKIGISTHVSGLGTGIATALAVNTGSAGAPVLFNGAGGTPSSIALASGTGLPISTGVSGLGTGVATFLATPSSANLATAVTGETGSGALVFATSPTLVTPALGAATATSINGATIDNLAWTSYTPTVTSASGTLTSASATGRYKQLGKTIFLEVDATVTTAGTGSGGLRVTLPFASASFNFTGAAYEYGVSATSGAAIIRFAQSTSFMSTVNSSGATFIANGAGVMFGITYEIP